MCDHERCAALHERLERLLDVALGFAVERGGGLVENQHRRVLEERARDSEPLPLPARKAHAVLADHGAKPFRHFADELHCVRRFGGLNDVSLTRSREAPVGDVRGDRVVEQHDILAHQRDVRAQAAELEGCDVHAVEQDLSGIRSVEARQQVGERGLARAGGPDQGNGLARFDRKRNPIQSRASAARIAESDGSEFDFALRAADLARSGIGLGPLVDQAKYTLRRGEPPLQGLVDAGQPAQRRKHQQQRSEKRHESAHGRLVRGGLAHREIDDECESDRHHDLHQRHVGRSRRGHFHVEGAHLVRSGIEASCLVVLSAEHLDDAMTADRFLQGMVEVAHRRLLGPAHGAQPVRECTRNHDGRRSHEERH